MEQFTANEVVTKLRERFTSGNSIPVPDVRLTRAEFDVIADLLEAREKAVPVMVVNHVSSAEHDLPIGMKLYAHPAPSDAERLADAVFPSHRACVPYENHPGKRIVGFVIDESHPWWGKCGLTEPLSALEAALASQENLNG